MHLIQSFKFIGLQFLIIFSFYLFMICKIHSMYLFTFLTFISWSFLFFLDQSHPQWGFPHEFYYIFQKNQFVVLLMFSRCLFSSSLISVFILQFSSIYSLWVHFAILFYYHLRDKETDRNRKSSHPLSKCLTILNLGTGRNLTMWEAGT